MKSVRTALRVFEEVAACQPVGLSELSRRVGVPKASVQRALTTLADAGWLRHDVTQPGLWVVTARFSVLADASPSVIAVRDAARPVLARLRPQIDGSVAMFVLDGDRMVLLAGVEETTMRSLAAEQGPLPVHVSAAGRAILSRLPAETVEEILGRVVPADAAPSVAAHVRDAVARARADGFAVVAGEYADDLGVVATAIVDESGAPVAALAVMVPIERLAEGGADRFGTALGEAALAVSEAASRRAAAR